MATAAAMVAGMGAIAAAPAPAAAASSAEVCGGAPEPGFRDAEAAGVHKANVACVVHRGISSGTSATTYGPTERVTRAQMATFVTHLVDVAGEVDPGRRTLPPAEVSADAFADDDGDLHEGDIDRLAQAGIVSGTGPGTYSPGAVVTRSQMTSFLAKALEFLDGQPLPVAGDFFIDDVGGTHEANTDRLARLGVVGGVGGGRFAPGGVVSRAQMASFVVQALTADRATDEQPCASVEAELRARVDELRQGQGLAPLAVDGRVRTVARAWAQHLSETGALAHNDHLGADLSNQGISWRTYGENLGRGTIERVEEQWLASAAHRANLFSTAFTSFDVGCVVAGDTLWIAFDAYG